MESLSKKNYLLRKVTFYALIVLLVVNLGCLPIQRYLGLSLGLGTKNKTQTKCQGMLMPHF